MGYDSLHRLISTSVNGATATQFAYVGDQLAVEFQVSGSSYTVLRRYVPGIGEDQPIMMYNSSSTTYPYELLEDHAGSIIAINSAQGDDIHVNRFDDFGNQSSLNWGRYQYTGQVWLSEVGLYNYKARMYSPTLGRFMQTDPIGYADGPNLYQYVHGDPVNQTDPSGLADDNTVSEVDVTANRIAGGLGGGGVSVGGGTAPEPGSGRSVNVVQEVVVTAHRLHLPQSTPGTVSEVVVTGHRQPSTQLTPPDPVQAVYDGLPDFIQIAANGGPTPLRPGVKPNQVQNRQFKDAMKKAERTTGRKFTPAQEELLHDEVTGEGLEFDELVEIAIEVLLGLI